MSGTIIGRRGWELGTDRDSHRDYVVIYLIKTDDILDGPFTVLQTPGLPLAGSYWFYGNDVDPWAFASPECRIRPVITEEIGFYWLLELNFSTRPLRRCQDSTIGDPLNEPFRISGSFNPQSKEKWFGRDGKPFLSSSKEFFTGPEAEFDDDKPTVRIGMNLPFLPLDIYTPMRNTLNDSFMWGCPPLCVKFSNVTFSRNLWGTCNYYYSVDLDFDIDFNTFDRPVWDTGTRYLKAGGNPNNQKDYIVAQDTNGNRPGGQRPYFLDGAGGLLPDLSAPVPIVLPGYNVGNLFILGVPPTLG